jgi:hypothetical protein
MYNPFLSDGMASICLALIDYPFVAAIPVHHPNPFIERPGETQQRVI